MDAGFEGGLGTMHKTRVASRSSELSLVNSQNSKRGPPSSSYQKLNSAGNLNYLAKQFFSKASR